MSILPKNPKCKICGKEIKKDEKFVLAGVLYGEGWTTPLGRLDRIIGELTKDEGGVYHNSCLKDKCPECDLF
jgi:hypothetical protein